MQTSSVREARHGYARGGAHTNNTAKKTAPVGEDGPSNGDLWTPTSPRSTPQPLVWADQWPSIRSSNNDTGSPPHNGEGCPQLNKPGLRVGTRGVKDADETSTHSKRRKTRPLAPTDEMLRRAGCTFRLRDDAERGKIDCCTMARVLLMLLSDERPQEQQKALRDIWLYRPWSSDWADREDQERSLSDIVGRDAVHAVFEELGVRGRDADLLSPDELEQMQPTASGSARGNEGDWEWDLSGDAGMLSECETETVEQEEMDFVKDCVRRIDEGTSAEDVLNWAATRGAPRTERTVTVSRAVAEQAALPSVARPRDDAEGRLQDRETFARIVELLKRDASPGWMAQQDALLEQCLDEYDGGVRRGEHVLRVMELVGADDYVAALDELDREYQQAQELGDVAEPVEFVLERVLSYVDDTIVLGRLEGQARSDTARRLVFYLSMDVEMNWDITARLSALHAKYLANGDKRAFANEGRRLVGSKRWRDAIEAVRALKYRRREGLHPQSPSEPSDEDEPPTHSAAAEGTATSVDTRAILDEAVECLMEMEGRIGVDGKPLLAKRTRDGDCSTVLGYAAAALAALRGHFTFKGGKANPTAAAEHFGMSGHNVVCVKKWMEKLRALDEVRQRDRLADLGRQRQRARDETRADRVVDWLECNARLSAESLQGLRAVSTEFKYHGDRRAFVDALRELVGAKLLRESGEAARKRRRSEHS